MTAASGLVEQVTTLRGPSLRFLMRDLNQTRRVRRMQQVVRAAAHAAEQVPYGAKPSCIMVTLTYREGVKWEAGHIRQFIQAVKLHLDKGRKAIRYQWVLELTKRGRVHYHVLLWLHPLTRLPKPDESGLWLHGMSRIERARRAVGYICKYASKGCGDTDRIPRGARLFGVGSPSEAEKFACHRAGLPRWLRERSSVTTRCVRIPRAGWCEKETGLLHASPYRVRWWREPDAWHIQIVNFEGVSNASL